MMSKPRLTNRILLGIIEMGCLVEAGSIEDYTAYGEHDPESKAMWDRAFAALGWARAMREHRAASAAPGGAE